MKYRRRDLERNTKIREELKVKPITESIETKQLKWYGHVKRMGKKEYRENAWKYVWKEKDHEEGQEHHGWKISIITSEKGTKH